MDILSNIVAIFAVLLGFGLSELASYFRRRRDDNELRRSVRKLLHIEIDRNLQHLRSFMGDFKDEKSQSIPDNQGEVSAFQRIHMPIWESVIFSSQLDKLGRALNTYEIEQLLHFYSALDELSTLEGIIKEGARFDRAYGYLTIFESLAVEILNKGNPI